MDPAAVWTYRRAASGGALSCADAMVLARGAERVQHALSVS